MEQRRKSVVISGYYGFGNSGDEAVLQAILTALAEESAKLDMHVDPIVLSGNPPLTASMYGVRAVHRMKFAEIYRALKTSDGLVSGGGSLLQDETGIKTIPYYLGVIHLAHLLRKKVFIYAQGIGPIHRRIFHPMIRNSFNKCALITVRDTASAELLEKIGIAGGRVQVVPDPVMGIPRFADAPHQAQAEDEAGMHGAGMHGSSRYESGSKHPLLGVSVRFWERDRRDLTNIARALELVLQAGKGRVVLLPFHHPADTQAAEFVQNELPDVWRDRVTIASASANPLAMARKVADCDALLGMRLHSLIYAASQYVPFAGISYDPKIDAFLHRMGMAPAGYTDRLDPAILANEALRLLEHAALWRQEKQHAIEEMRSQSRLPAQQLLNILRI